MYTIVEKVRAIDRLSGAQEMLARAAEESLSNLEKYILQKAVGLFLLGERNSWGSLHARAAVDGLRELSPPPRLTDDESDEVIRAMTSLEKKGLLLFEPDKPGTEDPDFLCGIGAIRNRQRILLKNEGL